MEISKPAARSAVGALAIGLIVIAVLVMALRLLHYLDYAQAAISYPFGLDYGEGIVWQQAMLVPSARMYGDINQFPFLVFHYPPVYYLAVRAIASLNVDPLMAGRCISVIATVLTAITSVALVFYAMREKVGSVPALIGAAVAGLSFFCFWPVFICSALMRVDMLALALSFLGLWCATLSVRRPLLLYCAAGLFVLAVFTKQTSIWAAVASMAVMSQIAPRRTLMACSLGFLLACTALAALEWATAGRFLQHILAYNVNRYSFDNLAISLVQQAGHIGFVVLALIGLGMNWQSLAAEHGWRSRTVMVQDLTASDAVRLQAIIAIYLLFSSGSLVMLGKSGASFNYMIEWMAILSMLIGILFARVTRWCLMPLDRRPAQIGPIFLLLVPTVLIVQVLRLPVVGTEFSTPAETRELADLVVRIGAADRVVLSEDMVLLMKAGKGVPWEPAIFAELGSIGRWDERLIIDRIVAHDFAFVVTAPKIREDRFTKPVRQAIAAAYPRTEDQAGFKLHLP
jgi:hypothetical protein